MHNFLVFIPFVAIAAVFWLILALDDEMQQEYEVRIEIVNQPENVTFIDELPKTIHVTVRDRGTSFASRWFTGAPTIKLDFKSFSNNGLFRLKNTELRQQLQSMFGSEAQLLAVMPDSISATFTTSQGKYVPVVIVSDITPQSGKTIGQITASPTKVKVFAATSAQLDTISCVYTYPIVRRDLESTLTVSTSLTPLKGCRTEPATVSVTVPIEPLENRSIIVPVTTIHVPPGETLQVYPNRVKISFLVPINSPEISKDEFSVVADYADIERTQGNNLPLSVNSIPAKVENAAIELDSVEYMVIHRGNGE